MTSELLALLTHLDQTLAQIAAQFAQTNHDLGLLISLDIGLTLAGIGLAVGGMIAIIREVHRRPR